MSSQACEGSATQAFDARSYGSFDFARRLPSLRVTRHALIGFTASRKFRVLYGVNVIPSLRRIRDPSVRREELRILRLRSQAPFAQGDTARPDRVYSVPQVSGPIRGECHPELAKDPRPKRSTRGVTDPSTSLAGS